MTPEIPTSNLWLFIVASFLFCASPGPNMLTVMSTSALLGFKYSLRAMAGCFLAVIVIISLAVAGVGILVEKTPTLFHALRVAGALYLLYLGLQSWRQSSQINIQTAPPSDGSLFWKGFSVGISNPKALLFATAFFSQFIDPGADKLPQLALYFSIFSAFEIGWYFTYALGGRRIAHFLHNGIWRQRFKRATGSLFIFFAVLMLAKSS